MKEKVIFILGPTGVGKTDMGVYLAKKYNGEIISADSVQVYKGFDIGSAKVTENEMQGVPHHNIDICHANDYFTVYDFVNLTKQKIEEISQKGKLPIIVGGTGLYVKALTNGYNFGEAQKNQKFREKIEKELAEIGFEKMLKKLYSINPEIAEKVNKNNKHRLIRAFEIATFGEKQTKQFCEYDFKIIALIRPRELLYDKINLRVDKMLEIGLVDEVKTLIKQGAKKDSQPMKAIGYKEVVEFLEERIDYKTMSELIKQHSRNYAKRQLTFLRGMDNVNYIDTTDFENAKTQSSKLIEEWK